MAGDRGRLASGGGALTAGSSPLVTSPPQGYAPSVAAKLRLNLLEKAALVAVIVTSWLCFRAAVDAAEMYRHFLPLPGAMQVLGVLGWVVATFAPTGLALCFWRLAPRLSRPWLLHLLFPPCAVALFQGGAGLMLFVVGDPAFDSTLGGPVLQASFLLAFAMAAYPGALIGSAWRRRTSIRHRT